MQTIMSVEEVMPAAGRRLKPARRQLPVATDAGEASVLGALTIMAHDLRGPLANLALLIERIGLQLAAEAPCRASGLAKRAGDQVEAITSMLNGFLRRMRETGDPLAFHPTTIDLHETVSKVADLNRPLAEGRRVTLDLTRVQRVTIMGDRALLIQAIDNLVGNAVKHSPPGSTVTCETVARGRDVVVSVADEGSGLSESDVRRAFRPFSTRPAYAAEDGSSWGLGLWIVRLVAERHGGRVTVAPRDESHATGARFEIVLPRSAD